ncbi:MAG: HNH endonuclease [Clostridia bacterium]|nr:HNH endonuclease [Clostridia bacterium]
MSSRGKNSGFNGLGLFALLIFGLIVAVVNTVIKFVYDNKVLFMVLVIIIFLVVLIFILVKEHTKNQRKKLLSDILNELQIPTLELGKYDYRVVVKSHQALENYSDVKFFKENDVLEKAKSIIDDRVRKKDSINTFLKYNSYMLSSQYEYVKSQLVTYSFNAGYYRVLIVYITPAGNNRGERILQINPARINEFVNQPELLMSKGEYNRLVKEKETKELDAKKHFFINRINSLDKYLNNSKNKFKTKSLNKDLYVFVKNKKLDEKKYDIYKIKTTDSVFWLELEKDITEIDKRIKITTEIDKKIVNYYNSEEFKMIKETCKSLIQAQEEFNKYISEKANAITQLFGKRIVRNETQIVDKNNYIRPYKKSITPFTAEVSSSVFASAENNPIDYIIKYFYPNRSQYPDQINKLRVLIEELETLNEAKIIIENYKKDYKKYLLNVPEYILKIDEDGFYSRLGLTIIDESVLNVEYRFTYTSEGGKAQRTFPVPMSEENIIELINRLESKLSIDALAKEQRALMTTKLRNYIKERDNYTCCECGNSIYKEPNLLLEVDHINPISNGGLTKEDNLQTLCWKCNRKKGSKIITK